jgi:glycosyltransferase involved in cell wall biosynthesis
MNNKQCQVSIIMPCLNEEETIALCIENAQKGLNEAAAEGEILVVDNGSNDRSVDIASNMGARVVSEATKGYGAALRNGIEQARGEYIIMGDADATYDFSQIKPFIDKLKDGNDFVMGSRLKGDIEKGAMPFLHRYLGSPLLTLFLNISFGGKISDVNCGMRGFKKGAISKLNLHANGMEFASEMVIKALLHKIPIAEIPIRYKVSPAKREPHLRTFRDGWRHLKFMILFSPTPLFILPGALLFVGGIGFLLGIFFDIFTIFKLPLGLSSMVFSLASALLGMQLIFFGISAKFIGFKQGLIPEDKIVKFIKEKFHLETCIIAGSILCFIGLLFASLAVIHLLNLESYNSIDIGLTKLAILSATLLLFGVQLLASGFYIGLLDIKATLK